MGKTGEQAKQIGEQKKRKGSAIVALKGLVKHAETLRDNGLIHIDDVLAIQEIKQKAIENLANGL